MRSRKHVPPSGWQRVVKERLLLTYSLKEIVNVYAISTTLTEMLLGCLFRCLHLVVDTLIAIVHDRKAEAVQRPPKREIHSEPQLSTSDTFRLRCLATSLTPSLLYEGNSTRNENHLNVLLLMFKFLSHFANDLSFSLCKAASNSRQKEFLVNNSSVVYPGRVSISHGECE